MLEGEKLARFSRIHRVVLVAGISSLLLLPVGVLAGHKPGHGGSGGGHGGGPGGGGDSTAPGEVTDLLATGQTHHTASLTWTATEDDKGDPESGGGASYDVRYLEGTLNDNTWDEALRARGEPTPGSPGTAESFTLKGLLPGTAYEMGIKVIDEEDNASLLSNIASVTTDLGAWEIQRPAGDTGNNWHQSIAFDPITGEVSVLYRNGGTMFAQFDGSIWNSELIDSGSVLGPDMVFDPVTNEATVAYRLGTQAFFSRRVSTGSWNRETVDSRAHDEQYPLAYDGDRPTIAYRATVRGKTSLKLARWNGSAWDVEILERPSGSRYRAFAYDLDGDPGIAYSADDDDDGTLDALRYTHWNGSSWDVETVETGTAGFGVDPSLIYDPTTGFPAVTHEGPQGERLHYLSWDGSSWQLEIVANEAAEFTLGLAPDGTHTIAYIRWLNDVQGNELWIARRACADGCVWETEFISTGVSGGQSQVGLAFDSSGRPAISFYGMDGYRVATER